MSTDLRSITLGFSPHYEPWGFYAGAIQECDIQEVAASLCVKKINIYIHIYIYIFYSSEFIT